MIYYSHSKTDIDGKKYGSKLLKDHISGVEQNTLRNIYHNTQFELALHEELIQICIDLARYHDLGKYTSFFQDYLLNKKFVNKELKAHSKLGANCLYEKRKKDELIAIISAFLIRKHHGNLDKIKDVFSNDEMDEDVFNQQIASLNIAIDTLSNEIDASIKNFLSYPNFKQIRRYIKRIKPNIEYYFITNYLFSLLIESDKLDASDTIIYQRIPTATNLVDNHIGHPSINSDNEQNNKRNQVRLTVLKNLENEHILEHKLFTFTGPTGIGKTLTALDFSIKLKQLIFEKEGVQAQIIYALPFINIIEQSLDVYNKVFDKTDTKILAHYQFADVFEQTKNYNEENNYNQKKMLIDTWQSDIVITSFVQMLHTLIGYKNKILKKFHHFAGSIIILDEVQTIRLELNPLIGAALYYLSKFLNARIILMTATKPLIFPLAKRHILENESINTLELLPNYKEVFAWFNRTKLCPILSNTLENEDEFISEAFEKYWSADKSCIIVCNTVNRSIKVYNAIQSFLENNGLNNPIEYLSTNIAPIERFSRIENLKKLLKNAENPILVSTQVVEAGVDLDFDMGFRDLAPLDSIIQVAGRINRNNYTEKSLSPLYIMDFGDCSKIYDTITETVVRRVLSDSITIEEKDYLPLIEKYFEEVSSDSANYYPSRKIFEAMCALKYDGNCDEIKNYEAVSSFEVIKGRNNIRSVFIELESGTIAKEKYIAFVNNEIKKEEFEPLKKTFHQHIITVPHYYLNNLPNIASNVDNLYIVESAVLDTYYNISTGYIRESIDPPSLLML